MAEQRPFKPFVEGSIPSALTKKPLFFRGFFQGKMNQPNLRYAKGTPITIARFVQTEQCGWAKYALFGQNGRRNKELIGWSSSPKAVGSIKRAERSYQQYFQLPLFSVLLASAFIGTNDERSPRNSSSRDFNRNRDKTGRISPVSTRSS